MSKHRHEAGHGHANLYDEITTKIISELEAGRLPWVQPRGTAAAKAPLAMPRNAATGRHYSGINVLMDVSRFSSGPLRPKMVMKEIWNGTSL